MKLLKKVLLGVAAGLVAVSAWATPANPEPGKDYFLLEKPKPVTGDKVEVIEFMWYNCPHCAAFEPSISAWKKKKAADINFTQVPVAFNSGFVPQQKLFYTLEAMGKLDDMNSKIFRAIHVERKRVDTPTTILDFVGRNGLDKDQFKKIYDSFAIETKARRATQMQGEYMVDGVPMVVIGGRYVTSPAIVGSQLGNQPESMTMEATLQVMDYLVKLSAEQAKSSKPATPAKKK